ncbi:MAG: hypothetical protein QXX20_05180 [Candidatus Thermoplasmatota archaeon]
MYIKKQHQRVIGIAVILVIIGIVLAGLWYSGYFMRTQEQKPDESLVHQKDDRISPLGGQQLTIEINRIRNRALYDKMLKLGTSWREKPKFYWVCTVDGEEANSFGTVGYGSEGLFVAWDSLLMDTRIPFRVTDEQPTSSVTISIVERSYSGLLKRRYSDTVKETIELTYDYRTGRWHGDDAFQDADGYGHFLGKNYELWFTLYQNDYDRDGIPYWTEVNILGTDPMVDDSVLDPDTDGIPTAGEWKWGYHPFIPDDHRHLDPDFDGITNLNEYALRKYFADPYRPDMYIETDFMQKRGPFDLPHIFFKESQQMIIEIFARHGINVYIDDGWPDGPSNGGGEMLPFIESFEDVNGGQVLGFYLHNFADERKGVFRYVIVGNKLGWCTPSQYNGYDTILVGNGWKPTIKTRLAFTPRHQRVCVAKGVLHELGHSLGLLPYTFPGNDITTPVGVRYPSMSKEDYEGYLNQYHSIMNYKYIWADRTLVDFSDGKNGAPYDQNDWLHIYLPTFNHDARAVEETEDEDFEDYELFDEMILPQIPGWKNLTEKQILSSLPTFKVYDTITSTTYVLVHPDAKNATQWNIKVYARPDIEPFPVIQSWTLVAEGSIDTHGKITFYNPSQPLI